QVAFDKFDPVDDGFNAIIFFQAAPSHQSIDFMALVQQKVSHVRAVLPGNSCDKHSHNRRFPCSTPNENKMSELSVPSMIYRDRTLRLAGILQPKNGLLYQQPRYCDNALLD